MTTAYHAPIWFFGYDVIFEVFFCIMSVLLTLAAYRIYRLTDQRQAKLFSISFLLISLSYAIQSISNFLIISELNQHVWRLVNLESVILFDQIGLLGHIIFMTAGLSLLLYMTLRSTNMMTYFTFLAISLVGIIASGRALYVFYLVSSVMHFAILLFFANNYMVNRKTNTLLVAIAFLFMFLGNIHFIFSVSHGVFYALGHILELIAYVLILANFYMVTRK